MNTTPKQLTREEAIAFAEAEKWIHMSKKEIAFFQFYQDKLCMPFEVFHAAMEDTLGHEILTHQFSTAREALSDALQVIAKADEAAGVQA